MKIAFFTDHYLPQIGGIEYATHRLAHALARRGNQVTIITPTVGNVPLRETEGDVQIIRIKSLNFAKDINIVNLKIIPFGTNIIRRILLDIKPDILHSQTPVFIGEQALECAQELHIPILGTNHVMPSNISSFLRLPSITNKLVDSIVYSEIVEYYNRCDYVTAPTGTALSLIKEKGVFREASAISNGIETNHFRRTTPSDSLINGVDISAPYPKLLYFGRLDKEKNVDNIIKALRFVLQKREMKLILAGTGRQTASLTKLVTKYGLEKYVYFAGHIDDAEVVKLYSLCDCYVIASTAELQSLTTLEAMACSLPIIAAQANALEEIVFNDVNGYLFTPHKPRDLSRKILKLFSNNDLREQFGHESRKIAEKHDIDKTAEQFESVYKYIIQRYSKEIVQKRSSNAIISKIVF